MLAGDKVVLYADDSPDDRYFMIEAYKKAEIKNRLAIVEDGAQVLDYLNGAGKYADRAEHPLPGLIILDIKMPNMTGLEALQQLRRSREWEGVPVLMLSASGFPADIAVAYQFGAYGYLLKPSSITELFELVAAIKSFWIRFNEYRFD
jgi:CheY-like chemotaxis protein